ncbi:MAG: epoxyqueuosine reductase [Desulfobacterales bacterium]|nr:epoxyqueuosine reductase [Desulfobacterales bacterium]
MAKLDDFLKRMSMEMGGRFFGAAELAAAREAVVAQGGEFLAAFPRAISIGIALNDGIVDQLPHHQDERIAKTYDSLYFTVNQSLNRISLRIAEELNRNGFKTLLVAASQRADGKNIKGLFSHKLAANLAGLGWIGPSCLLITPEMGPRVRWVTILTDAPLETGAPAPNGCGDCRLCVDACPAKAFTGRPFTPAEPRAARFKIQRCIKYREHLNEKKTGVNVCGMCVHVCPFGLKQNGEKK